MRAVLGIQDNKLWRGVDMKVMLPRSANAEEHRRFLQAARMMRQLVHEFSELTDEVINPN